MDFEQTVDLVGKIVDGFGVAVIVIGITRASVVFLKAYQTVSSPSAYEMYRRSLGRAILLGLELLVASDIIRTVATAPTFTGLGVLGLLILIRTFLSVEIEMEIEGRWPWQQNRLRPPASSRQPEVG